MILSETMNTFLLTVSPELRNSVEEALSDVKHVTLSEKHAGKVAPPNSGGIEFEFKPDTAPDKIKVTVISNPQNLSMEDIHGRLDSDIEHLLLGPK